LIATFALVACTMFVVTDNVIDMFMEYVPNKIGRTPEEKEMLQVQLEQMRRQLNQVDTDHRRERNILQAQLERLRTTLEQERERQEENKFTIFDKTGIAYKCNSND
jgi:predicted RNase H-like nuclease (RuvC/YqgF family)